MNIIIKRECNCIRKLNYIFKKNYLNKQQLEDEANAFLEKLISRCCETHTFSLENKDDNIIINSTLNFDKAL